MGYIFLFHPMPSVSLAWVLSVHALAWLTGHGASGGAYPVRYLRVETAKPQRGDERTNRDDIRTCLSIHVSAERPTDLAGSWENVLVATNLWRCEQTETRVETVSRRK